VARARSNLCSCARRWAAAACPRRRAGAVYALAFIGPWAAAEGLGRGAQVADLGAAVDRLKREKVKLEQQMEMEEEGIVNRLQRQIETLLAKYKARARPGASLALSRRLR